MLVATDSLKAPELRIGTIGENITLPRTVRAASLAAGAGGGFIGIVLATILLGMSVKTLSYGAIVGAAIGVALVSYSPLKGESLGRWVLLKMKARRLRTTRDGRPVRLAVGIAYVEPTFEGPVQIRAGAANVRPGTVGDQFTPVVAPKKQMNAQQRLGLNVLPTEDDEPRGAQTEEQQPPSRLAAFRDELDRRQPPQQTESSLAAFRAAQLDEIAAGVAELTSEPGHSQRVERQRHGQWIQNPAELSRMYGARNPDDNSQVASEDETPPAS